MQGQFSNDIQEVSTEHSQLNSYNSPKGRMYASFRLYQFADDYLIQLPRENLEPTLKRLQMFVLRSDVQLQDVSDEWVGLGISGPQASDILAKQFNASPASIDAVVAWERGLITQIPGAHPRFIVLCQPADARAYWEILSQQCKPAGSETWKLLDIRAGVPNIYLNTREEFVAQMVNFHSIGGVNFKKGCYPGQEIVARMHYLGKLKKRMYRIQLNTTDLPAINDNIYVAGKAEGQSVGQLVDCARVANGVEGLAVLQINNAENDLLCLENADGPAVSLLDLPYEVSNEA
jgi:folate-binding protein YgfZ